MTCNVSQITAFVTRLQGFCQDFGFPFAAQYAGNSRCVLGHLELETHREASAPEIPACRRCRCSRSASSKAAARMLTQILWILAH